MGGILTVSSELLDVRTVIDGVWLLDVCGLIPPMAK